MTAEEYKRAIELYSALRALPKGDWAAAVASACPGDALLGAEVMRLLDAGQRMEDESFLERSAIEEAAALLGAQLSVPETGTLLGRYRLGAQISAGGMGVVFEAVDERLQRKVAVKVLALPAAPAADEGIRRFRREALAISRLNHPNIISIYDADFEGSCYFIAMEYVEGQTLRSMMLRPEWSFDEKQVAAILTQTASALTAAHQAGIVHRDIKPENIMLRADGLVKVLDFGLAMIREPAASAGNLLTRPGQLAGTVQYLSPEQVLGQPATPRSDLFSLGVVAYELVTGVRPFDGPNDWVVFSAILNEAPKPPSAVRRGVPAELDALVMRALEKDPDLRHRSADDFLNACGRLGQEFTARSLPNMGLPGRAPAGSRVKPDGPAPRAAGPVTPRRRIRLLIAVAGLLAAASTAVLLWLTRPIPPPRVTGIVQITGGEPIQLFVTDGTRLYYAAGNRDADMKVFQISAKGGDPILMPQLTGMFPFDISPDRTEMMLGQIARGGTNQGPYPIWVADTLGNAPRRVNDLIGSDARWSPKGDQIVYCKGTELWLARSDGTQAHRVAAMKGSVFWPAWSPDGGFIRFTLGMNNTWALWQVRPDGTDLRAVFPGGDDKATLQGSWTPDGKYFIFAAGKIEARDLWAVRTGPRFFWARDPAPVRLTTGPTLVSFPVAGADGHRIFFQGALETQELVRYDRKANQWSPYLGELPAAELDYSRDGKWITYIHAPEGSIFRSASDGTERRQLTPPAFFGVGPRWSPDGAQIAFYGHLPGQQSHIYVVPAAGGSMQQLTHGEGGSVKEEDGSWSPDGASIVFGAAFDDRTTNRRRLALGIIDVRTQRVSKLPASEGLWSPRWSPDGRSIVAIGSPSRLWLYNPGTGMATKLTNIPAAWPSWSRDGRYVYFQTAHSTEFARVKVEDRVVERAASLAGLSLSGVSFGWVGLALDGSPITMRIRGSKEIYALDWELP